VSEGELSLGVIRAHGWSAITRSCLVGRRGSRGTRGSGRSRYRDIVKIHRCDDSPTRRLADSLIRRLADLTRWPADASAMERRCASREVLPTSRGAIVVSHGIVGVQHIISSALRVGYRTA
jgi:hypothetical protein